MIPGEAGSGHRTTEHVNKGIVTLRQWTSSSSTKCRTCPVRRFAKSAHGLVESWCGAGGIHRELLEVAPGKLVKSLGVASAREGGADRSVSRLHGSGRRDRSRLVAPAREEAERGRCADRIRREARAWPLCHGASPAPERAPPSSGRRLWRRPLRRGRRGRARGRPLARLHASRTRSSPVTCSSSWKTRWLTSCHCAIEMTRRCAPAATTLLCSMTSSFVCALSAAQSGGCASKKGGAPGRAIARAGSTGSGR